ncbi:MAG: hypothetical protein EBS84_08145 [Proteobacteria bacterium]|nr:hypothetical protein [Verrucomicrobiota bacterium]NBU08969.1 hypothetical protein [Pseudomonadota bacterium]
MKSHLLSLVLILAGTTSGSALTIVPTYDGSITNAAQAVAITNAINVAIQNLQSNLTDDLTVKILFVSDANIGLGQSSTWFNNWPYSDYLSALQARATSRNDALALSKTPATTTDPLANNSQIHMTLPLGRLLGLTANFGSDGFDSTISLNTTIMNFTRSSIDPNKYDLIATAEHEINEVLGSSSNLGPGTGPTGPIAPIDLFRYTTNLVRTWTTNGDDAYFSIDGTNLLARFNQQPDGDYGDFWSKTGTWSPPGTTPAAQVQDAFAGPGVFQDEGPNELAILDVIGYTLASTRPTLNIAASGVNQVTLSWPSNFTGFVLQERTLFGGGTWTTAASGGTTPATAASTGSQKYFRLVKNPPVVPGLKPAALSSGTATEPSLQRVIHVTRPRAR